LTHHRTGTHWNNYGAFIAYRKLMIELAKTQPALKPYSFSDFNIKIVRENKGRGLAKMLGLVEHMHDEEMHFQLKVNVVKKRKLPKLVIYSDSYTDFLLPFLNYHFQNIIRVKSGVVTKDILYSNHQKPSAVILEVAERYQGVFLTGRSFS